MHKMKNILKKIEENGWPGSKDKQKIKNKKKSPDMETKNNCKASQWMMTEFLLF